jgi:glycosyltransferase involved in cell wall biosynthesis
MTLPSVAVIVPNRNDAGYLPKCLRSVLDQAVRPDELIVVDDCSTDDSIAVASALLADMPHARLVRNSANLGVYGAIHEGLRHCTSEYVLFLSANDFVLPDIFARAKACLARCKRPGLWSAMAWLVDDADRRVRLHPSAVVALGEACLSPARASLLARRLGNWFTGPTVIYRRDALEAVGRFDPAYGGLADLFAALAVASLHGAGYSPEPLGAIRIHPGSYLSSTLANRESVDAMMDRLRRRGPEMAPALFTPFFIDRTTRRIQFAARRAAGAALPGLLIAFLRLRPFDLWPAIWNRALGWLFVQLREKKRNALRRW